MATLRVALRNFNGWRDSRTIVEVEGIHIARDRTKDGIKARGTVNRKPYRTKALKEDARVYARKIKGAWHAVGISVKYHSEGV